MTAPVQSCQPMTDEAPHVPAAFINAISEEGTKAEAVAFLQKQWNENRVLWHRIRKLEHDNNQAAGQVEAGAAAGNFEAKRLAWRRLCCGAECISIATHRPLYWRTMNPNY
jgi:hypothetical protein